jgi:hypothetical protein
MSQSYDVWADPDLAFLAAEDAGLLAVADALVDAGRSRKHRVRRRLSHPGILAAAAVLAVLLSTSAFALGGRLWRIVDGTPVKQRAFSKHDWKALSMIDAFQRRLTPKKANAAPVVRDARRLGFSAITLVATRNGERFYLLKRRGGTNCFGVGPVGGFKARPKDRRRSVLAGVECRPTFPFPSRRAPIFDMTVYHGRFSKQGGVHDSFIWKLRGLAADPVAKVGVMGEDGTMRYVTPVVGNAYNATGLPRFTPKAIVALDAHGNRVYTLSTA